ncbi:MAG TPA: Uma2 family endonuclease [Bacteroidetes bacterium]|nr:Uma2 family endonuclease [Bacteroidota bacterium]
MGDIAVKEAPRKVKQPKKISIETFLRKYRKGGPGVKYEYNKGIIEKTEAMKFKEQFIANNIVNHFEKTKAAGEGGKIVQELEVWTSSDQWRKPDLSYITVEQTRAAAKGEEPIPEFIIEVISKNDKINEVKNKVYEYFNAGVKVLWHIFPEIKTVDVYRSPEDIQICSGSKICSAEPAVKGLKIKAKDIFKLP